jgi:hypothetical protein
VVSIVTSLGGAVSIMLLEPTHEPLIPDWEATTPALDGQPESVAR